jgi:hypothetical protein
MAVAWFTSTEGEEDGEGEGLPEAGLLELLTGSVTQAAPVAIASAAISSMAVCLILFIFDSLWFAAILECSKAR